MIQFRYESEEKYRMNSIDQVKQERQKIIENEEKKPDEQKTKNGEDNKKGEMDEKMEKIIEEEKKALEKIKKKQKMDIEAMIEEQINNEIRNKMMSICT